MERRQVLFSGHVQGVGFRYTTRQVAKLHRVSGFVRNLPDGRVELWAEGDADEVARFVAAIERRMKGHIDHVESEGAEIEKPDYEDFSITG